jgi:exonuclease III
MALRAQIDTNTVIVGDLNTPPSPIDRSSRQKITKKLQSYYTHPTTRQFIFFYAAHRTFSKIDHILGHKEILNKFKKI